MIALRVWRRFPVLPLWLLATGCGSSDPSPAGTVRDSAGIAVIDLPAVAPTAAYEIEVFDDPGFTLPSDVEFGRIADISVAGGIIAVLDELDAAVTIFDSTGNVIAQLGREGGGPGEFDPRGLASVVASDEAVWVPDVASERLTRFAADGRLLETRPLPWSEGHAVDWERHPAGGQILRIRNRSGDLVVRSHGAGADTVHRFAPARDAPNTVLAAIPLWTVLPDGAIAVAWTDDFELSLLEPANPEPTWIVRRDGSTREITDGDEQHLVALLEESLMQRTGGEISAELRQQMMSSTQMPVRSPVLASLWTGPDDTIWIERAKGIAALGTEALRVGEAAGLGSGEWEIFDRDGSFRGTARLPDGFVAMEFVGPLIYGVQRNELDVPTVRRLRIVLNAR